MGDTTTPPAKGQFCHKHFSWLCQAGQGKCQRGEDPADPSLPTPDGTSEEYK